MWKKTLKGAGSGGDEPRFQLVLKGRKLATGQGSGISLPTRVREGVQRGTFSDRPHF